MDELKECTTRLITVKVLGPLGAHLSEFYSILSAVQKDPVPCTYLPGLILCLDKCVFILSLKHHEQRMGRRRMCCGILK